MKAVDANVLLRLIVADDPKQEATVRDLIGSEQVYVPLTVMMECEWVLRSYYKKTRQEIAQALDDLTDLQGLVFEQLGGVRWALKCLVDKADFADMIHILAAAGNGASAFVTFDDGIEVEAGPDTPIPVHTLR